MKPVAGVLPQVAIVASQASLQMGGEAALAVQHFRGLLALQVPAYLVCHARARKELTRLFPQAQSRIFYVPDTWLHVLLWKLGQCLPQRVREATTGMVLEWLTQRQQLPIIQALVLAGQIDVVHQPMPVSPKAPSCLAGLGVPVVMGPMNGGMDYPPGLAHRESRWVRALVQLGRGAANLANRLIPGKLKAEVLLVANARTRKALPQGTTGRVFEMVENGVDLSQWPARQWPVPAVQPEVLRLCFVGRLVSWKAVDLLLRAFAVARSQSVLPLRLDIVGDGPQASALHKLAKHLRLSVAQHGTPADVVFHGWLDQADCSQALRGCDALVLPSVLECGGAVVLEAMASALPVIATDWGGPAQYLDASCGILVPVTSERALMAGLADAMQVLAHDAALRHRMGLRGRQKVAQKHAWHQKTKLMLAIYAEIVKKPSQVKSMI